MKMEEYLRALENHVASHKLNLGDGESVLSLLYEAYGDINRMYDDQIKADFSEIYQALNGMPLQKMDWIVNPVCTLCRVTSGMGFSMAGGLESDCFGMWRVENNPYITPRLPCNCPVLF